MPPEPSAASSRQRLRRLPGRGPTVRMSRAEGASRLWMDDRQLVQETVRFSTQEIQRFALADIQAIQLRRTVRGWVYNAVLCALLSLPLIGLITQLVSNHPDTGARIALSITVGIFGLLLLVNVLRGPTCRTVLLTALGPQPLPSLNRMRVARRALGMIATNVEAVQGVLPPDEAVRLVDNALLPRPSSAPAVGAAARANYDPS